MKKKKSILLSIYLSIFILLTASADKQNPFSGDFKEEMRNFVIEISNYTKEKNSEFLIIPQNGAELVTMNGEENGDVHQSYLKAINAHGQEDLYFGYEKDNKPTSGKNTDYLEAFLDKSKAAGNIVLVTDYCSDRKLMDLSFSFNSKKGYISFAANQRELNNIPIYPNPIYNENSTDITSINQVKNFLYLINPENFSTKERFISTVSETNYDLLIMDIYFHNNTPFTENEINLLKNKANGGKRLVICYMSIGEAEDYRFYWNKKWNNSKSKPLWLEDENSDWEGNYKVQYWNKEWKDIILYSDYSYINKILSTGFDGVYLDIIDAFEYFE